MILTTDQRRWTLTMLCVASLFATACSAQEPPKPATTAAPVEAVVEEVVPSPLIGQWTLTRLDGRQPMRGGWPVTLTINQTTIDAQSQCVPFRWTYTVEETRLRTATTALLTADGVPIVICSRGLTQWETRFKAIMDGATSATIQDDGDLVIGTGDRQMSFEKSEGLTAQ